MPNKVLVADDSQTIRSVAEFLLRQKGFEVVLAKDGEEALALIKKSSPELLLLDNSMPFMDGYTLCQELKKDPNFKNIPVVMLLNSRESLNQEGFRSAGCEDFILKPFSPREFLEKVEGFFKKEDAKVDKASEYEKIKEPSSFPTDTFSDLRAFEVEEQKEHREEMTKKAPKEQDSYERFVSEFKKEMEGLEKDEPVVYREMKLESLKEEKSEFDSAGEDEFKALDYENLSQRIVREVSTKVAERIAEKINTEEIQRMIKEKIKELV